MKYHLILSGWLLTKQMQQVLLRIWKNQNLGTLLVETQNGAAVMKTELPYGLEMLISCIV
jgi:ABC-type taurine transport system ATPase subunit